MLALLSEGPKYGLGLREEFEDRTGEVWPVTHDAQLASWADRVAFLRDGRDGRVADQTTLAPDRESLLAPRETS
jgi:hypothetical protein